MEIDHIQVSRISISTMTNNMIIRLSSLMCLSYALVHVAFASDLIVLNEISTRNLGLKLALVEERDFEKTVFAIGRIEEIPEHQAVLSSRVAGRIIKILVYQGDHVKKDQVLAIIESRQLGNPPPRVELKSPRAGIVVSSHIRVGEPVEPSEEIMDIVDRSKVWARAQIPERDASLLTPGSRARITIPAPGMKNIEATLKRFGLRSDPRSASIEGLFELNNKDNKLSPGMRAEFNIIISQKKNVLSIPRDAVQGDPSDRFVMIKDFTVPNAFSKAPVVLGEHNDLYIEVVSGLFPGDEVVTEGSYALSFAGATSGMSLKEALDMAHGHEHNEDGSEITPEQRQKRKLEKMSTLNQNSSSGRMNQPLLIYAIITTLLCLFLFQIVIKHRKESI